MQRLDAVGLATLISSALKLGCTLPLLQQQPHTQLQGKAMGEQAVAHTGPRLDSSHVSADSASIAPVNSPQQQLPDGYVQLLQASKKQVAFADGHAAGMLLAALTLLLQQQVQLAQQDLQQQQLLGLFALQQQLHLWLGFTSALSKRLQECAAVHQLSSQDASKLCSCVSRLAGTFARQRTAAVGLLAGRETPLRWLQQQQQEEVQDEMQEGGDSGPYEDDAMTAAVQVQDHALQQLQVQESLQELQLQYSQLQQQLRALVSLAAQQVELGLQETQQQQPTHTSPPGSSLADVSRVLSAVAKTWAWPGWGAVLGLLQQYSREVLVMQDTAVALSDEQSRRKGKKRQQQGLVPGMPLALLGAGSHRSGVQETGEAAQALTAVRESLSPTVWAAGRLSEQQLQHWGPQHKHVQWGRSEVRHHVQLWHALLPVLAVSKQKLSWLGPLQLVQLAAGLGKLVQSSRTLLELQQHASRSSAAVAAGEASGTPNTAAAVADGGNAPGAVSTAPTQQPCTADAVAAGATAQGAGPQVLLASSASQGSDSPAGAGDEEHAQELASVLNGAALSVLLQQHVRRVEAVLPLLVMQHRLQIAAAYSQLGVQLPRGMAAVFERDAAQHQQQ
jgi:hypothetical protein